MKTNTAGRELIKSFESLRMRAYPDPGTGAAPWTIGWGHTCGVKSGDACGFNQADRWLDQDIALAESAVSAAVKVPLSVNQFSALVSFVFNVGADNFRRSTLLRLLNAGDYSCAADQFLRWDKAGGQTLPGLTRRRNAERYLFMKSE